ncbi:MAG: PAS domain-containing protein [Dongiaceae bacterium]
MKSVIATRLEIGAIPSESLQRMLAYWQSKCGSHSMPARADIDPVEFAWGLGNICLLDVQRSPLQFRYRLAGTRLTRLKEVDLTGRSVDDIQPAEFRNLIRKHLLEVVETAKPNLYCISITNGGGPQTYVRLALPLRAADGSVGMILTMIDIIGALPERDDKRSGPRRRSSFG